jgi:hypothetical protein
MFSEIARLAVADGPHAGVNELLSRVALVDHHTHSIVTGPIARSSFIFMLSESDRQSAADAAGLDSQVGVATRRWCAPLLGLPAHVPAAEYLERRLALPNEEAAARLLRHAGFERLLIDTGYRGDELLDVAAHLLDV